jgi:D-sedoheptulose 7-phosphate isomerase
MSLEKAATSGSTAAPNTNDTRDKNRYFSTQSVEAYMKDYAANLQAAISAVDPREMERAIRLIADVRLREGQIFVAGNGGSAAISDHLCCDWTKGTDHPGILPLRTHSLSCNTAVVTALANDFSYQEVFSAQLKYAAKPNDLVILISSSGNSPNVVEAAQWARQNNIPVISLVGFEGGKLRNTSDVVLFVPFHNYGIVEDSHQALMHVIAQFVYLELKNRRQGTA